MADEEEYKLDNASLMTGDEGTTTAESAPAAGEEAPSAQTIAPETGALKHQVLMVVGVLLVGWGGYMGYMKMKSVKASVIASNQTSTPSPTLPAPITPALTQKAEPEPSSLPAEPLPAPSAAMAVSAPAGEALSAAMSRVTALQTTTESVQGEVSALGSKVGQVQVNLQALSDQITKLTSVIESLTQRTAAQDQEIIALGAKVAKIVKLQKETFPSQKKMSVSLKAAIPGRAWLIKTSSGETLTVREGSVLAGYGKIQHIDPVRGRVDTSSGKRITFPSQEK